ncbi:hypothetical protein OIU85_022220 [Salix viminalis]|uniref:Uncharacterized protein n=1 Tax=Salix viminalis TaxID=40686 RepID=A0A9Q0U6C0_SALVM|nr:hypothetical protein OIU85_022220 [Salix viminalis]
MRQPQRNQIWLQADKHHVETKPSKERIAHRVLLGNGRRTGMREAQQKQMAGEKERRWNSGTVARTPI